MLFIILSNFGNCNKIITLALIEFGVLHNVLNFFRI